MKFQDKSFELVNIPIGEFRISINSDKDEIEKLMKELETKEPNSDMASIDDDLKFYGFENFTWLDYMMLTLKYRNIKFTKVFDINNKRISSKSKKD